MSGALAKPNLLPDSPQLNVIEEEDELAESQKHKLFVNLGGTMKSPFSKMGGDHLI